MKPQYKNGTCAHCGNRVAEDGYAHALGGDDALDHNAMSQHEDAVDQRHDGAAGFAAAVRRKNLGGYADGGPVEPAIATPAPAQAAPVAAAPAKGTATETATEVRSPTSTKTSTETDAYTQGNVTVTGGAGDGDTIVHIKGAAAEEMKRKKAERYGTGRAK